MYVCAYSVVAIHIYYIYICTVFSQMNAIQKYTHVFQRYVWYPWYYYVMTINVLYICAYIIVY